MIEAQRWQESMLWREAHRLAEAKLLLQAAALPELYIQEMETIVPVVSPHDTRAFFNLIKNPLKLKLYLLSNLPAASFAGLRLKAANEQGCTVAVPYKWFTKNPFRSTYFACLSMAAEFSTGVLAMAQLYKRRPKVSMLVTGLEAKFYKKATGQTFFTCTDGDAFKSAITEAIAGGLPQEVKAYSIGTNEAGEKVAEFWVTWSFKKKG